MFRYLRPLLLLMAFPAIGIIATLLIDARFDLDRVQLACSFPEIRSARAAACSEFDQIVLLRNASWATLLASVAIPIVFLIIATVVGRSRFLIAIVFGVLVKLSIVLTGLLILVDAAIVTFSLYWGFALTISRIPVQILALVALAGLAAALGLLKSVFTLGHRLELKLLAKRLSPDRDEKIISIINTIAQRIGAPIPDHIIVGLDPKFFVTSADVKLFGESHSLKGETLYLSAPLLRILKPREFIAVIAHELGHFVGQDTLYSKRFAPIYAQLTRSLDRLTSIDQASNIANLPGVALLGILMAVFASKERKIGRGRELAADKIAASLVEPEALIAALVKISVIAPAWPELRTQNIESLNEGRILKNLCGLFANFVAHVLANPQNPAETILQTMQRGRISHPTDTHPSNAERAKNLNVNIDSVAEAAIADLPFYLQASEMPNSSRSIGRRGNNARASVFNSRWYRHYS